MPAPFSRSLLAGLAAALLAACSSDPPAAPPDATVDAAPLDAADAAPDIAAATADASTPLAEGCDPLVPSHCGLPFPSNTALVADPTTPTGRRVRFGRRGLPRASNELRTDPEAWRHSDGFSAAATMITHLPGATSAGLADPDHIERSLAADSPTVVIAEDGTRVPHVAELDARADDARRALMLQPMVRLRDRTRYIVAIRNVRGPSGAALPPSDAFRALRDRTPTNDPDVESRRALYDDLFQRLERAGVARADLQLAWDFTTASRENNTAGMLRMRDDTLRALPPEGPAYTLTSVRRNPSASILLRIEGTVRVPLYLDRAGPGGRLVLDDRGLPVRQGDADYPFLLQIPASAARAPASIVQFGHGLFGDRFAAESDEFRGIADRFDQALLSMDWLGMSTPDVSVIGAVVLRGDVAGFRTIPDRGQQGFLAMQVALRMAMGALARDPMLQHEGRPLLDPTKRFYFGGSQGGIYGASYMALTTDVERGVLAVPGQPYGLMLQRSIHWDIFSSILERVVSDPIDVQVMLGLVQMYWDRAEPSGYAHHIAADPLPGTPAHRVLILEAIGDHQVPNLSSHVMARAIGARNLAPVVRPVFGLETVTGAYEGSGFIEYDFGLPPVPLQNLPMRTGRDPHGSVGVAPALRSVEQFFQTGRVQNFCDGPCDPV